MQATRRKAAVSPCHVSREGDAAPVGRVACEASSHKGGGD